MVVKNNRWLQYLSIVVLTFVIVVLEVNIKFLGKGLLGTPFLVIVAATATVGDFVSSVISLVLGTLAVNYVTNSAGFSLDSSTIFKTLEFLLSGIVVYLLAFRGNKLRQSNLRLLDASKQLQDLVQKLKDEARGSKKQINMLNSMNTELRSLVDQFVADDSYWARKWPSKKR